MEHLRHLASHPLCLMCLATLAAACSDDSDGAAMAGTGAGAETTAAGTGGSGAAGTGAAGTAAGGGQAGSSGGTGQAVGGSSGGEEGGAGAQAAGTSGAAGTDGDPPMCSDVDLYPDADGDGDGTAAEPQTMCIVPGQTVTGFAETMSDCADDDPWKSGITEEICNDRYDDNCSPDDDLDPCPTTQEATIDVPSWDCVSGDAPSNVVAYAHFPSGDGYFEDGACALFFEGAKDTFYVTWSNLGPAAGKTDCEEYAGCVCPTNTTGSSSWDRRLYALTKTEAADCPPVTIIDHGGNDQPVSNDCRKYLYALHGDGGLPTFAPDGQAAFDLPFSYVAGSLEALEKRLSAFPVVEIACLEVTPVAPWASLLESTITRNPGFQKLP